MSIFEVIGFVIAILAFLFVTYKQKREAERKQKHKHNRDIEEVELDEEEDGNGIQAILNALEGKYEKQAKISKQSKKKQPVNKTKTFVKEKPHIVSTTISSAPAIIIKRKVPPGRRLLQQLKSPKDMAILHEIMKPPKALN